MKIADLFVIEKPGKPGLLLMEKTVLCYTLFTLLLMVYFWRRLHDPVAMLLCRGEALAVMAAMWGIYRLAPCRFTMLMRVVGQMALLGIWYPDTYEFNRLLPNLDHLFARAEQQLFFSQPALIFAEVFNSPVLSELMAFSYVSYYPLIAVTIFYFFLCQYEDFQRTAFIIMASFFMFYVVFIFLPVAGPQYYYLANGLHLTEQGVFLNVGHYFEYHQESLPIPGWEPGVFHHLVEVAHAAGERPTAAFPSSHVGIMVVLAWLSVFGNSGRLFWVMAIFTVLMFFSTFYIQAHYAIDAIAGVFTGTLFYFLNNWLYDQME